MYILVWFVSYKLRCKLLCGLEVSIFEIYRSWVQSLKPANFSIFAWFFNSWSILKWFCIDILLRKVLLILENYFLLGKNLLGGNKSLFEKGGSFKGLIINSNEVGCSTVSTVLTHRDCWTGTNKYYWLYKYNRI